METMCILAMRVIKSPIAFHLAETDNRGVGMFFAHMTEENRLSYYDLENKDTNVPKYTDNNATTISVS